MKTNIKIILALAIVAITFVGCNKKQHEGKISKPHQAKYEVVSVDGTPAKVSFSCLTQSGVGYGQGLEHIDVDTITPWQTEFTSYGDFQFIIVGYENADNVNERKHFIARIYLDGEMIAEQQSNESYGIYLTYAYDE